MPDEKKRKIKIYSEDLCSVAIHKQNVSQYKPQGDMWIHSHFGNVMKKFMINNRTGALKTDINLFFMITNCRIAGSRLLTHCMNFKFMCLSHCLLTINISEGTHVNFCRYCKNLFQLSLVVAELSSMGESRHQSSAQTSLHSVCTLNLGQDSTIQTSCSVYKSQYIIHSQISTSGWFYCEENITFIGRGMRTQVLHAMTICT